MERQRLVTQRGSRLGDQMARGPDPTTGGPADPAATWRGRGKGPARPALPDWSGDIQKDTLLKR
eukprot:7347014-Pyramimonas_sp.AAC.1